MNTDKFLTDLWEGQNTSSLSDVRTIKMEILKLKKQSLTRMLFQNVALALTVSFLVFVGIYSDIPMAKEIGIVFLIIASFSYILANSRIISLFKNADAGNADLNGKEYLMAFISQKEVQFKLHKIFINIYFIALGIGICL